VIRLTLIILGWLSAYCLGPTQGTLEYGQEYLGLPQDVSGYDVLLAVEDCSLVGSEATLRVAGYEFSALVFDCAGPDAYDEDGKTWLEKQGYAAEVDWWFWQQYPELIGVEHAEVVIHE